MNARISMRYTVALEGFSEFEREALASFFRLAEQRAPAYSRASSMADSDFVVADADQSMVRAAVRRANRLHDTVFIGTAAPPGSTAWLRRPIEPTLIVRELDLLLELRLASLNEPAEVDWVPSQPAVPLEFASDGTMQDVLVVDDSRIALKFLQTRLQRLGFRVYLARNAAQALERLDTQAFSMVFLDVVLGPVGSMDGLAVCQHIKQRRSHPNGVVPAVVMVTGLASSSDRVRGALAGCDAYLTKPLMEDEFLKTLRQLDRSRA